MSNTNTKHSRSLRVKSAREARQRIIATGGVRVEILLEKRYAEVFKRLGETCGTRKQALNFLIDFYLEHRQTAE
jgi:hypothetical protein